MPSFQWTHLPFPLNCEGDHFKIYRFQTSDILLTDGVVQYLVKVVIHQAFLIYWAFPLSYCFRNWIFFWFSWDCHSEELTKLLSAVCITAATHRPHQGERKSCLQARGKKRGEASYDFTKSKLGGRRETLFQRCTPNPIFSITKVGILTTMLKDLVLLPWSKCEYFYQQGLHSQVQWEASQTVDRGTPLCYCC